MTTVTVVDNNFNRKLTDLEDEFPGKNVFIIHESNFTSWILKYEYSQENLIKLKAE